VLQKKRLGTNSLPIGLISLVFRTKFMPAANDNGFPPGLQIAAWKMLRAGMPPQVILSTLDLTACDLTKLIRMTKDQLPPAKAFWSATLTRQAGHLHTEQGEQVQRR
jgi:hypothetical protein